MVLKTPFKTGGVLVLNVVAPPPTFSVVVGRTDFHKKVLSASLGDKMATAATSRGPMCGASFSLFPLHGLILTN